MTLSRGLLALLAVCLIVDSSTYSAITPLLPHFVEEYGFTRATAGVLTAANPIGTVLFSLPAALLVSRVGAKRMTIVSLAVLGVASLGFALATSAPLLVLARLGQGIGACGLWSSALAWTFATADPARRSAALGTVVGAAIFGAVGGPALGSLADVVGVRPVFSVFVVLPAVLIVLVARRPAPPAMRGTVLAALRVAVRDTTMRRGVWLMLVPACAFGGLYLLVPLRLDGLGFGAAAIGALFLVAAALESTMSPVVGRIADRRGPVLPARVGLALGGTGLVVLALPLGAAGVAVLVLVVIGVLGMLWTPAMTLLAAGSEDRGVDPAFGFGLANLAWGVGTTIGGVGGGALAEATTDAVPFLVLGVAALATVGVLARPPRVRALAV